jgi:hypothetical protein
MQNFNLPSSAEMFEDFCKVRAELNDWRAMQIFEFTDKTKVEVFVAAAIADDVDVSTLQEGFENLSTWEKICAWSSLSKTPNKKFVSFHKKFGASMVKAAEEHLATKDKWAASENVAFFLKYVDVSHENVSAAFKAFSEHFPTSAKYVSHEQFKAKALSKFYVGDF